MLVIRAETHKMHARKANREDLDQQSDLGLPCLSRLFLFGRQLLFEILEHLPIGKLKT